MQKLSKNEFVEIFNSISDTKSQCKFGLTCKPLYEIYKSIKQILFSKYQKFFGQNIKFTSCGKFMNYYAGILGTISSSENYHCIILPHSNNFPSEYFWTFHDKKIENWKPQLRDLISEGKGNYYSSISFYIHYDIMGESFHHVPSNDMLILFDSIESNRFIIKKIVIKKYYTFTIYNDGISSILELGYYNKEQLQSDNIKDFGKKHLHYYDRCIANTPLPICIKKLYFTAINLLLKNKVYHNEFDKLFL